MLWGKKARRKMLVPPKLPLMPKNEVVRTQTDPHNKKTINKHKAFLGLEQESQLQRQVLHGEIKASWPGTEDDEWFPQLYRPQDLPENPLDWSEPLLEHLKDLALATVRDMELAHDHLQAISEKRCISSEGRLCSNDLKEAVRRRYKEMGAQEASTLSVTEGSIGLLRQALGFETLASGSGVPVMDGQVGSLERSDHHADDGAGQNLSSQKLASSTPPHQDQVPAEYQRNPLSSLILALAYLFLQQGATEIEYTANDGNLKIRDKMLTAVMYN